MRRTDYQWNTKSIWYFNDILHFLTNVIIFFRIDIDLILTYLLQDILQRPRKGSYIAYVTAKRWVLISILFYESLNLWIPFVRTQPSIPLWLNRKKIVRAIAGVGRFHHTEGIFDDFRLLKLESINKYMSAIFMHKCLNDVHFSSWFTHRDFSYHTRASANRHLLNVPQISNVRSEKMISYRGPKLWNEIPVNVIESNYNSFKFLYKSLLILDQ